LLAPSGRRWREAHLIICPDRIIGFLDDKIDSTYRGDRQEYSPTKRKQVEMFSSQNESLAAIFFRLQKIIGSKFFLKERMAGESLFVPTPLNSAIAVRG
jgi:hypothetical protein